MSETSSKPTDNHLTSSTMPSQAKKTDGFVRSRWFHVLALADQLRHNTELNKTEQLRKYAFDIPAADGRSKLVAPSVQVQTDRLNLFQNELLFPKTGNFTLDNLGEKFLELQRSFNRMLELPKHDVEQLILATSITKTALLMILRSTECIVGILTKGTKVFPTLNSLISYVRSRHTELPIDGRLLVDWYSAAHTLELLVNDSDWLVQPRKAHWAMNVCNETLAWGQAIFHQNNQTKSTKTAIFDREDSIVIPDNE